MKIVLLLFYFTITTGIVYAQANTDSLPPASLQACIDYALKHQPAIQQTTIDQQIVEAEIRSRLADWLPQIGTNFGVQHNFQRQTSFFNGQPVPIGVNNTSTGQVFLDQAIFSRDILLLRRTRGDLRLQTRQATTEAKIDVAVDVSKAFYDVLTTRQQIQVAQENISRLEKSLNDAYYRYQSGIVDKTDYKRAQIALNNTTAQLKANQAAEVGKIERLKATMGYPPRSPLSIVYDSLQLVRETTFDTLQIPVYNERIEYQQLTTQRRLLESEVIYERNGWLPTISANVGYNFNYFNNSFGKLYGSNYPNSFVGLTAGLPIFQGGRRRANVRAAALRVSRLNLDLVNIENSINSEFATALSTYKGSLANFLAAEANIALAQEVYDVLQLQYQAGIKTYLEVITAETELRTAKINYFNALYQVLVSKLDTERALGNIRY